MRCFISKSYKEAIIIPFCGNSIRYTPRNHFKILNLGVLIRFLRLELAGDEVKFGEDLKPALEQTVSYDTVKMRHKTYLLFVQRYSKLWLER